MFRALTSRTRTPLLRTAHARAFSLSSSLRVEQYPNDLSTNSKTKTDLYDSDTPHAKEKVKEGDTYNIQESNMKDALDKKGDAGGHAVEQRDSAGGKQKAKEEFPEAPDVAIGMQDERGGRGGR